MEQTGRPLRCRTVDDWRSWLERNHGSHDGIWLMIAKKGSKIRLVTLAQATEEALCFGWIDSAMKPVDDDQLSQPRHPRRERGQQFPQAVGLDGHFVDAGAIARNAEKLDLHMKNSSGW